VAVAFADSSIVVLALPELYLELDTTVGGVSWIITAFNLVVVVAVFALLPVLHRMRLQALVVGGLVLFLVASIACGISGRLVELVVARSFQGLGAALLLAGSLPVLNALTARPERAIAVWTSAATLGLAVGPALGGILTHVLDWRAIFVAQAPVAGLALLAVRDPVVRSLAREEVPAKGHGALRANLGLLFLFGALVGALFLAVLLVVTVWDLGPLAGAGVVSALPAGALATRPLSRFLPGALDVVGGSLVLAGGLTALALLPASSPTYAVPALFLCGAGLGLAVPPLTRESVSTEAGLARSGIVSLGARHLGLVVALVLIAPLLAYELSRGGERATLNATATVLDAPLRLTKKIPIALSLRDELDRVPEGTIPDLQKPFEKHGVADDPGVAAFRDALLDTIEAALTRSFRTSFGLAAVLAALAAVPVLGLGRPRA
jgi:MFS family permease